jgi:ABC-type Na+ efflux pump permease subunit
VAALLAIVQKDLRLLLRDRAALVFIAIAPVIVISVAGFSLANFYGADPTGQTAYDFPVADQDGGQFARELVARLGKETSVRVYAVEGSAEAERLVRAKRAGNALVIPPGTQAALDRGDPAHLVLYTDPVKYLERLNVRVRLLELRDALAQERRTEALAELGRRRAELDDRLREVTAAVEKARATAAEASQRAAEARAGVERSLRAQAERLKRAVDAQVERERASAMRELRRAVDARAAEVKSAVDAYLDALSRARRQFEAWLGELRRLAGRRADDIPAPPAFPEPPPELLRLLEEPGAVELPALRDVTVELPRLELPPLDEVTAPPALDVPALALPELPADGASLGVDEVNVTGGPMTINTFDQNVPGFSVTFLLLGMLLGVSLGLLDERDWGTFGRLLATPMPARNILLGKLLSRFLVGFLQMLVLFAVGYAAFGISLGSQPWALLLPIVGIVLAGTAFGLIVAVTATSREAVLPVGSIVIVTMAAVGGCWWPIDLEPRWMRTIALAFPTTWAMEAFNDLMIRRRGIEAALIPTAVMLAYAALYLVIGIALFERRIARRV